MSMINDNANIRCVEFSLLFLNNVIIYTQKQSYCQLLKFKQKDQRVLLSIALYKELSHNPPTVHPTGNSG